MIDFKDLKLEGESTEFSAPKISINKVLDRAIIIHRFKTGPSKFQKKGADTKCLTLDITLGESSHIIWTNSENLLKTINKVPPDKFPIKTTIVDVNGKFIFT